MGDAVHFLRVSSLESYFSHILKQGQEWVFWIGFGEKNKIFAYDFDSTIAEYQENGLTDIMKKRKYKHFFDFYVSMLEFLFLRKNSFKQKIAFEILFSKAIFTDFTAYKISLFVLH